MNTSSSVNSAGRVIITVLLALVMVSKAGAYSFMPLVTCYSAHENCCATQAWDATQSADGTLYFGTTDGLLSFDGVRWEHLYLSGIQTVRSVRSIDDRTYLGAYEEFGYIELDSTGRPEYHSLKALVTGYDFRDDEFWSIVPHGNNIYFQSFRCLFCYDGKSVKAIHDPDRAPLYLFNRHGALYAQLIYKGLSKLRQTGYEAYIEREALGKSDVVAMLPWSKSGVSMLCTGTAGLLMLDESNGRISHFKTEIDSELTDASINRAIRMKDGTMAIGTIRDGVYAITPEGKCKWHYNIENGLGNNSVLGLHEDTSGNLWVMLDHGISVIHAGLPYYFLRPHAGEPYIGMTYDMLRVDDKLYVGTNQGLYTYSFENKNIIVDNQIRSQIWHINAIDNQILVGGGTLSARFESGKLSDLNTDSSTDIKKGLIHNHEVLIESSYYAIRVYLRDEQGNWYHSHDIEGFGAPIRQIEIDSDGAIWCSHLAQGVIRIELSPDLRTAETIENFRRTHPDKPKSTSFVMKIRGQIALSDGDSLYTYNQSEHRLTAMETLHHDLPSAKDIYSCTPVDDRLFWLSSRKAYTLVSYNKGHYKRELTIPLDFLSLQSNGVNNCVYVDNERNCYFAINNGVGCVSLNDYDNKSFPGTMSISSVEHSTPDGILTRLPVNSGSDQPAEASGNIRFSISYPAYNFRVPKFIYRLEGPDKSVRESDMPHIDFVGLHHGNYKFTASMIDENGDEVAAVNYAFTVPTPPYLSYWAMSGYTLALGAIIFGISKLYSRRQVNRQRQRHEIETVAQNVKILEQERIIAEQQKQLLEQELSVKSKELASMALEAGYKHQVIENLRETINAQRHKGSMGSTSVDALIKTFNSDIGNNEFWEIFHNNFDLIHENFFRNLRQRYPELTATDFKFCALLRLNMSTKDIAKFTQMTVRGVETARYRLRRKLGLGSNESIVQFLIDFK